MADIAPIFLLPPPTPPQQRLPTASTARDGGELAANADAQGGGDSARARRFRFRVYEGSESGEASGDVKTRRTDPRAALGGGTSSDTAGSSTDSAARTRYSYNQDSGYAASSTFIAQSIAQEHLGEGLHNPPNAAASAAYTRSGAALNPRVSAGVNLSV